MEMLKGKTNKKKRTRNKEKGRVDYFLECDEDDGRNNSAKVARRIEICTSAELDRSKERNPFGQPWWVRTAADLDNQPERRERCLETNPSRSHLALRPTPLAFSESPSLGPN